MPTTLCLLRHGRASGQSRDADLSPEGEAHVSALGSKLAAEGFRPRAVFTSPYRRAHRTALLVLAALGSRLEPVLLHELAADSDAGIAHDALLAAGLPEGPVLVVGHMPLLAHLALLVSGQEVGFAPGTLVEIELAEPGDSGRLVRRLGPEDLAT